MQYLTYYPINIPYVDNGSPERGPSVTAYLDLLPPNPPNKMVYWEV